MTLAQGLASISDMSLYMVILNIQIRGILFLGAIVKYLLLEHLVITQA